MGLVILEDHEEGMDGHPRGKRVLVKFSDDLRYVGLNSHNEIENSLWMFVEDLVLCPLE